MKTLTQTLITTLILCLPLSVSTAERSSASAARLRHVVAFKFKATATNEQIKQVEANPNVVVMYYSRERRLQLRFYGVATVHKEGPIRDAIRASTIPVEIDRPNRS